MNDLRMNRFYFVLPGVALIFALWPNYSKPLVYKKIQNAIQITTSKIEPPRKALDESLELMRELSKARQLPTNIQAIASPALILSRAMGLKYIQTQPIKILKTDMPKPFLIKGHLEIRGLGFGPERNIRVVWQDIDGQAKAQAAVNINEGVYQINVPDTRGKLLAELIDENGLALGKGQYSLDQLNRSLDLNTEYQTGELDIPLKILSSPAAQAASVTYAQANENNYLPNSQGVSRSQVKPRKSNSEPQIDKQTYTLAQVETPSTDTAVVPIFYEYGNPKKSVKANFSIQNTGFKKLTPQNPTLITAQADLGGPITHSRFYSGKAIPLFREATVQAMDAYLQMSPWYIQSNSELVWGTVSQGANPAPGVEIVIENVQEAQVVYLNEFFMPDPSLKATSSSGQYVIAYLTSGHYSLSAYRKETLVGHENFIVDDSVITYVDTQIPTKYHWSQVYVFDAFSSSEQAANVDLQSLLQPVVVTSSQRVYIGTEPSLSLAHVNPISEKYIPATYVYSESSSEIYFPMLRYDWLAERWSKESAYIIGFFPQAAAEIKVNSLNATDGSLIQVDYFDASGQFVSSPQLGGGFMIRSDHAGVFEIQYYQRDLLLHSNMTSSEKGQIMVLSAQ
jgi:hypothetical protein